MQLYLAPKWTELSVRFHIWRVFFFFLILCAKLENPKSQLWVVSNDRKCFLDLLDTQLHLGPTNDGALSLETALLSCSVFHQTTAVSRAWSWCLNVGENGEWLPFPQLCYIKHWKLHVGLLRLDRILNTPNSTSWVSFSDKWGPLSSMLDKSNSWQSGGLHHNSTLKSPYVISSILKSWQVSFQIIVAGQWRHEYIPPRYVTWASLLKLCK